jgi:hypothetical protein
MRRLRAGSQSRLIGVAVVVAAAALVVFRAFTVDDAFIAYRHALNLARGAGAVMNAGERVEGVSNLPWTMLLGGAAAAGVAPHAAGPWLSALAALAAVVATAWCGAAAGVPAGVAALASAAFLPLAIWGASGMETASQAALVAAALAVCGAPARRPHVAAILFAAVATLRPEGVLFGVASALVVARSAPRRAAWIAGATLVAWGGLAAFRLAFYGDWLPNPARAKIPSAAALVPGALYVAKLVVSYPLAFAALGVGGLAPTRRALGLAVLAAQLAFTAAAGGDHFAGHRFLVSVWSVLAVALAAAGAPAAWRRWTHPLFVAAIAVAGAALVAGPDRFVPLASPLAEAARLQLPVSAHGERLAAEIRHAGVVLVAVAAYLAWARSAARGPAPARFAPALVLVAAVAVPQAWDPQLRACRRADGASRYGRVVGTVLRAQVPRGTLVATNAAGALPYFSDLPVVDMLGLTDRRIARARADNAGWIGHERGDGVYVLDRRPGIVILGGAEGSATPWAFPGDRQIAADPRFARDYLQASVTLVPERDPPFDFVYFVRRDCGGCLLRQPPR